MPDINYFGTLTKRFYKSVKSMHLDTLQIQRFLLIIFFTLTIATGSMEEKFPCHNLVAPKECEEICILNSRGLQPFQHKLPWHHLLKTC